MSGEAAPRASVKLVHVDHDHIVATFGNTAVLVWLGETRVQAVREATGMLDRLALQNERAVGLVQIIETGSRTLDSDSRAALTQLLNNGRRYIRCSAVVCEGAGFRAAAVRMIVSGIVRMSDPGFPHEVFADVGSAVRAHASHFATSPILIDSLARELTAAIAEIRSSVPPPSAARPILL
jgi:hypothetical protein